MKWITREHAVVERVAVPWLITRFIDNDAEFIFVHRSKVHQMALELDATPFDVDGADMGHEISQDGTYEFCTFETMMSHYGLLGNKALCRMSSIIHCADVSSDLDKDPMAPGLLAIAKGFALNGWSDHDKLKLQFPMYDALYKFCGMPSLSHDDH